MDVAGVSGKAQKKRTALDVADKVKIIDAVSKGEKAVDVARRFGLSQSTVSTILAKKEKYLEA
jgi:DNA-binding NarL/FixJ family response regulator